MIGAAVGVLVAALIAAATQVPYFRNWMSYDFDAPDRQLRVEKYQPTIPLGAGTGRDIPPGPALAGSTIASLDAYFDRSQAYALLVARDGGLSYQRYAEGVDAATELDAWSMSKTMIAMAVGYGLETGDIPSLETGIGRWIGEWADDPRGAITVRQLLTNESGLLSPRFEFKAYNPALGFFVGRRLEETVLGVPLAREPGASFQFNHVNSQLLVLLLERATGLTYPEILKTYVWDRLDKGAGRVPLDRPGGLARGACCFISTAPNWLKLGMAIADGGRYDGTQLFEPGWIAAMTAPAANNPNFGFSLWVGPFGEARLNDSVTGRETPMGGRFAAEDTMFAEGSGGVRLYIVPSRRLAIIRFGRFQGFPSSQGWQETELVNLVLADPTFTQNQSD